MFFKLYYETFDLTLRKVTTVRLKTKLSIFKTKPQENSNKTTTKTQQKQNIQSKQKTTKQNCCDFVVNHT